MNNLKYILLGFCAGLVLALTAAYLAKGTHKSQSDSTSGLLSTTGITAEVKDHPSEDDLVVSQTYVANINGEEVKVPIVPKKSNGTAGKPASTNSTLGTETQQGIKATVSQTIDLTPVLCRLKPNWELGVGYSNVNNSSYIPFSIQRNYNERCAVEFTVFVNKDGKTDGAMVQHKWLIK